MSNKRVKSISFNITNEREKEFLETLEAEKWEFSSYVKELIFSDMERRKAPLKVILQTEKGGIKHVVLT